MATSKKARYRKALRYGKRIQYWPGIVLPPSVVIAYAHDISPTVFPLLSRNQWRCQYGNASAW